MTTPIPPHLASFPWYAPHLAWLRTLGRATRHDPGDAAPRCADLSNADLSRASLSRASLSGADLFGASLIGADLSNADLSGCNGIATEAEEAETWAEVRAAVLANPALLDMGVWHGADWDPDKTGSCGTTHCLAGWAQALSDDPKVRRMDPEAAGCRLLPRHAYLFHMSNAKVLALLRAEQAGGAS